VASYIGNKLQAGEFKKLDSIESSFDGSTTTFNLSFNGTSVIVGDVTNITVSLNGVIQEPTEAYTLATGGSQIVFSTAPASGSDCFITQIGSVGGTATPSDDSVSTVKIQDGAIHTDKVADNAVTSGKLHTAVTADIDSKAPKNEPTFTGDYVKIPVGGTGDRPTATAGYLRFNTDEATIEQYDGSNWNLFPKAALITSLSYSGSATAVDPAGGETVTISGANFEAGVNVKFGNTLASAVTRNSSTSLTVTTPALTAGDYDVQVINGNGIVTQLINGLSVNANPAWSSPAAGSLGNILNDQPITNITLVAAEDDSGTITYTVTSGALPNGVTLSNDTISGTPTGYLAETATNFTITATDDENQTATRSFTLTVIVNFYEYEIANSLKFNDNDASYLSWTPTSAGNRRTWTWSGWVKTANLTYNSLFFAYPGSSTLTGLYFTGASYGNKIQFYDYVAPTDYGYVTEAVVRDPSSWYHIVCAVDTTQAINTNRIKLYVNGVQQTFDQNYGDMPQNYETSINNTCVHWMGREDGLVGNYADHYLSEVNFVDGQALAPTDFGQTKEGVWVPKNYTGTYGTNGFHLPMLHDDTVEGFSTILYRGEGSGDATTHYVGGVGFKPDLVWIKDRDSGSYPHLLFDSVRGSGRKALQSNSTAGEGMPNNSYDRLTEFNDDGFTLMGGQYGSAYVDRGNEQAVAWCWDMNGNGTGPRYNLTKVGTASHSTSQSAIGGSSMWFDGSSGALTLDEGYPDALVFDNDFTYEFWVNCNAADQLSAGGAVIGNYDSGQPAPMQFRFMDTGTISVHANGTSTWSMLSGSFTSVGYTNNTWQHWAIVRKNSVITLYRDGVAQGTAEYSLNQTLQGATTFCIGSSQQTNWFEGYIDEVRVSNIARYNSDFTPSTTAFTNDRNTILLVHSDTTHGSTSYTDSSGADENTDGSITSYVSANTTYGQSIVSYTGNGTAGATYGHGLNSTPELIMTKLRGTADWLVYDYVNGGTKYLQLNTDAASQLGSGAWNNTDPTSSVVTVGTAGTSNTNGSNYISYCFHSVSGYSKIGSYTGDGTTSNAITTGFRPALVILKRTDSANDWLIIDSLRENGTDDNELHANSSAAEANDERLEFTDTGFTLKAGYGASNYSGGTYIYIAFADKRSNAFWKDTSGNQNDWTYHNLNRTDLLLESPTNNFATLNPLDYYHSPTWSEGNLKWTGSSVSVGKSTMGRKTGKFYFEICQLSSITPSYPIIYGMCELENGTNSSTHTAQDQGFFIYSDNGNAHSIMAVVNGSTTHNTGYFSKLWPGDVVQFAYDADTGKAWAGINGKWLNNGDPAAGTGYIHQFSGDYTMGPCMDHAGVAYTACLNAGQDSSFAGRLESQYNTDSEGNGDFHYEPPSGYLALCNDNLPANTFDLLSGEKPSDYFNTVIWSGDDSTSRGITGVGFQPDFVWLKGRAAFRAHELVDVVRGGDSNLLYNLGTYTAQAEDIDLAGNNNGSSSFGAIKQFDSDGFTVRDGNSGRTNVNASGENYVAWNWKAGGTPISNTNGSITSSVSANTNAGFSIVSFTSRNQADTIGHGLSQAPDMIILKSRDNSYNWSVYHSSQGNTARGVINSTDAWFPSAAFWNNTSPTSTVFSIGTHIEFGGNSDDMIAYCWHDVPGFSKFGSYEGNGATGSPADGTFVYTGFRPAFILIKCSSHVDDWHGPYDNVRGPYNQRSPLLYAGLSGGENVGTNHLDLLSNGFKLRSDNLNQSGRTFIYMAFAEDPFKYGNAR